MQPRGEKVFGWDPIFEVRREEMPEGHEKGLT